MEDLKDLTFRDASKELEQIVRALESGDLELEDSLEKYARGVNLLKELKGRLEFAEQQVENLTQIKDVENVDTVSAQSRSLEGE